MSPSAEKALLKRVEKLERQVLAMKRLLAANTHFLRRP